MGLRPAQAAVQARCANGSLSSLADSHPSDAKLVAAASALQELDLGVLDYGQYLVEVAFDKQLTGLLHQAEREIATGRAEAKRALAQLGH